MMTVISTVADPETLSLTVVAEFEASPERVWACGKIPDVSSAGGTTQLSRDVYATRFLGRW